MIQKSVIELLLIGLGIAFATQFVWTNLQQWGYKVKNDTAQWLMNSGKIRTARAIEKAFAFCLRTADYANSIGTNVWNLIKGFGDFLVGAVGQYLGNYFGTLSAANDVGQLPSEVKRIVSNDGKYELDLST